MDGRLAGIRTPICTVWACRVCRLRHEPLVPPGGLEPPPHGLRARRAAFTLRREVAVGANGGTRTRTSGLGRPAGSHYPTFALVRPTGIEPVPPRWQRGMHPPHSGRTWTGSVHRPIELCQLSKTPLLASTSARTARWRQRQDSNPDPRGLEARMLPLHHAVGVASHVDRFRDKTSP